MTIETMSDTELFDQNQNPEILNDIEDETSNTPSSDDEDEQLSVIDKTNNILEYEIQQPYNLDITNSSHDETEPEDLYVKRPIVPDIQSKYQTRSRGVVTAQQYKDGRNWLNVYLTVKQKQEFGIFTNLTIREAIEVYGDESKKAVIKELQKLIRLNVFRFHKPHLLTTEQKKRRIPSKTFIKPKYKPD